MEGGGEDEVGAFVVEVFRGEVGGRNGGRLTGCWLWCGFGVGWHYWNKRNSGSGWDGGTAVFVGVWRGVRTAPLLMEVTDSGA